MTDDQKRKEFGTSLLEYTRGLLNTRGGRWIAQAEEKAVGQAPPVIPSGPWSNNYAPNPVEPPFPVDINYVPPVDASAAPAFPAADVANADVGQGALPASPQVERARPSPNKGTIRRV
jgi:hypothetical protein